MVCEKGDTKMITSAVTVLILVLMEYGLREF